MRGGVGVETGRASGTKDILGLRFKQSKRERERVGVPPLRHPVARHALQEEVPSQTRVPAPIIIITLQGEPGACNPRAA